MSAMVFLHVRGSLLQSCLTASRSLSLLNHVKLKQRQGFSSHSDGFILSGETFGDPTWKINTSRGTLILSVRDRHRIPFHAASRSESENTASRRGADSVFSNTWLHVFCFGTSSSVFLQLRRWKTLSYLSRIRTFDGWIYLALYLLHNADLLQLVESWRFMTTWRFLMVLKQNIRERIESKHIFTFTDGNVLVGGFQDIFMLVWSRGNTFCT